MLSMKNFQVRQCPRSELEGEFAELGGWEAISDLNYSRRAPLPKYEWTANGDKVKVLLAKALFGKPDVLLLNEPTNLMWYSIYYLVRKISWLISRIPLSLYPRPSLLELKSVPMADRSFGKIKLYVGNYDFWKESSELAAKLLWTVMLKQKKSNNYRILATFLCQCVKIETGNVIKMLDRIQLEEIVPSSRKYPFISFKAGENWKWSVDSKRTYL